MVPTDEVVISLSAVEVWSMAIGLWIVDIVVSWNA